MFPDWHTILKHREVIRFACGLTTESQSVLEFVYDNVQKKLMESENIDDGLAGFLDSLWQEVPDKNISDPLHNRFINLISRQERSGQFRVGPTCSETFQE